MPQQRRPAPKKPSAKKVVAKKAVKKPTTFKQAPKSVPGSKGSFTAQMRAAGQRIGDINKPETKIVKTPSNVIELARNIKSSVGGANVYVLEIPWDDRNYGLSLGAKWNSQLGKFTYTGNLLPEKLKQYRASDFSFARWLEDEINGKIRPTYRNTNRMKPRKHQIEAITKIVNCGLKGWAGFLEADATGVGKTISSLLGVAELARVKGYTKQKPAKLLIICPKSVIPHWKNTLSATNTEHLRVVVINYEQSKDLLDTPKSASDAKKTRTKNKNIATQGNPIIKWDYIISDEAHKLKNYEISQRAKSFARIARYHESYQNAPFTIWSTATVGQTPLEIGYLAPIIGQMVKKKLTLKTFGAWLEQENYHVKSGKVGYTWVKTGPKSTSADIARIREEQKEDIQRIGKLLFSDDSPSIRRLPEDIAGWPAIQRIGFPVALSNANKGLYHQAWTDFRQYLSLHPRGKDPAGGLAQLIRFRQKSSLLRTVETIDETLDLLDNGHQVAISVEFIESLTTIKNGLERKGVTCVEFSGRNESIREQERLNFQRGKAQVILFTPTEGVSFHAKESLSDGTQASSAPRATLVHDVRYSAIQNVQISGRTHRDGQASNIYFMYAENTVEEKVAKVMLQRMSNMSVISGDAMSITDEIENMIDALFRA